MQSVVPAFVRMRYIIWRVGEFWAAGHVWADGRSDAQSAMRDLVNGHFDTLRCRECRVDASLAYLNHLDDAISMHTNTVHVILMGHRRAKPEFDSGDDPNWRCTTRLWLGSLE